MQAGICAFLLLLVLPTSIAHDVYASPSIVLFGSPPMIYVNWTLHNDYSSICNVTLSVDTSAGPANTTVIYLDTADMTNGTVTNVLQPLVANGTTYITGDVRWNDTYSIIGWAKSITTTVYGDNVVLDQLNLFDTGNVIVIGNLTLIGDVFLPTGFSEVPIIVTGDVNVGGGAITVQLTVEPLNGDAVIVLEGADGVTGTFSSVFIDKQYPNSNCQHVTGTPTNSGNSISVLISVTPKQCSGLTKGQKIGIGVGVGGTVLLALGFAAFVWYGAKHEWGWAKKIIRRGHRERRATWNA